MNLIQLLEASNQPFGPISGNSILHQFTGHVGDSETELMVEVVWGDHQERSVGVYLDKALPRVENYSAGSIKKIEDMLGSIVKFAKNCMAQYIATGAYTGHRRPSYSYRPVSSEDMTKAYLAALKNGEGHDQWVKKVMYSLGYKLPMDVLKATHKSYGPEAVNNKRSNLKTELAQAQKEAAKANAEVRRLRNELKELEDIEKEP